MSITSSDQKPINAQFSDLLKHYPRLATWLVEMVQSRTEPRAEAFLPSFLLECAHQGIPGNVYPFTSKDHGLADLRVFLRNAQEAADTAQATIMPSPATRAPLAPASQIERDALSTVALDANSEPGEIDDTPVVRRPDMGRRPRVQPLHAAANVTEHIPVLRTPISPDEIAAQEHSPDEIPADIARQITEPIPDTLIREEPARMVAAVDQHTPGESVTEEDARQAWLSTQETPRLFGRGKLTRLRHPRTLRERVVSLVLLLVILGAILVPAGFLISFGISAYTTYHDLSNQAHNAVDHLLTVRTIFSGGKSHLSAVFDVAKLQQAEREFVASDQDFQQLQNQLQHSSTLHTVAAYLPQYREPLRSAQAASVIGMDVASIGQI
ncbi:MAG: hypothetical protein ACRDHW_04085, partial [Ktedonobacteraceae bacterium]